ncbi:transposable element Tcb2 transposase [Trichonephila clavipes]|nr:transposable element Tcb2 transposase [Trichonephila clavipes]
MTPSTDQSSRRPSHRKKCTRTTNCFIGRYPGTGSTFIRSPCAFSNHTKAPGRRTFGIAAPNTWAADAHSSTPPFGGKWTAAEWNQVVFSDESRFNLSSDDNRVRVWRSRGEHLNPAFALQRHAASTAGVTAWVTIAY